MNLVERSVLEWIAGQDPGTLERWAMADEDVVPRLQAQYGRYLPAAKAWLGSDGLRQVRTMRATDLLDALLRRYPAQGVACWRHRRWFERQVERVRDMFMRNLTV